MPEKRQILLVEDDPSVAMTCTVGLESQGYAVEAVGSTEQALRKLANGAYPLVVTDIYLDERTGLDVLKAAKDYNPACQVIVITGQGTIETVMKATAGGAFDYLAAVRLLEAARRGAAGRAGARAGRPRGADAGDSSDGDGRILAADDRALQDDLARAPTDAPVLITGESGVGKERIAQLLHSHSRRAHGPFVPVDCGSIAPSLLESELFGAVRGAYTGAERDRVGLFEAADGGTVFLDEIGEIEPAFQLKLLRFLQEREIRALGSARAKKIDVRVIAATNRNLRRMVDDGELREDLWFRLNVIHIPVPPLRERRGDIPVLAGYFLGQFNQRYGRNVRLTPEALRTLEEHAWPGNVRQLQHALERLVVLSPVDSIGPDAVHEALDSSEPTDRPVSSLADAEQEQIRKVLAQTGGNKTRAAKILNIERKTLYRKLERMGL